MSALPEVFGPTVRQALESASEPDAEGWRRITLTFESNLVARGRLLGFADRIEVLEPAEVRAAVVEGARAVVNLYR